MPTTGYSTGPGELLGEGRTSEVFAYGPSSVVKVLRPGVPPHWARIEASIAEAAHRAGAPCPEVRGVVEVDGRESIVFQRVEGPSLWDLVLADRQRIDEVAVMLAGVQRSIHQLGPLESVPQLLDRVISKILVADGLTADERHKAQLLATSLDRGLALCHGDLHPGNILLSVDGPMVIDWFDAAIGSPEADLVRTSLLIRPPDRGRSLPPHLPGAEAETLTALHDHYLTRYLTRAAPGQPDQLLRWERVLAAGRLAEHTTADRADLLALWRSSAPDGPPSGLERAFRRLRLTDSGREQECLEWPVDAGG